MIGDDYVLLCVWCIIGGIFLLDGEVFYLIFVFIDGIFCGKCSIFWFLF